MNPPFPTVHDGKYPTERGVPAPGGLADGDSGGELAMENIRCEVSSHLIFRTIVGG